MSNESENANTSAAEAPATNAKRKSVKKAKPAKKASGKKSAAKPKTDRSNEKTNTSGGGN